MKAFKKTLCILSLLSFYFVLFSIFNDLNAQNNPPQTKTYHFVNGNWFNGKDFQKQDLYSVNGYFTKKRPAQIDETIDLKNGYVVPPFADAHCHTFDNKWGIAQQIATYFKDGVFYAKVQTNPRSTALEVANLVNIPTSVDVSYAHGALTASYGHGVEVYEGLAVLRKTWASTPEEVQKLRTSKLRENDAYYIIDTAADLEQKWQKILDSKPDFLKLYLLSSEEFEIRRGRTDTVGDRGVDPKLVPLIVKKAHVAGLRVSAHVDTVTDYRLALKGGVDEMAHMPGYLVGEKDKTDNVELTAKDAKETARRKIWVIPAPIAHGDWFTKAAREKTDKVLRNNLSLLKNAKVRIAFGSDRYGATPLDDVLHLSTLGVFTNAEILRIWSEETPQTIFPNRKIGKLKEGFEASFLVLDSNPLGKFENVKTIRLRFKQGKLLSN